MVNKAPNKPTLNSLKNILDLKSSMLFLFLVFFETFGSKAALFINNYNLILFFEINLAKPIIDFSSETSIFFAIITFANFLLYFFFN